MNTDPATGVGAVTPSDTVNFARPARALFIGTGGNISVVAEDGTSATFAVTDGYVLPVQSKRVNSTGTTATGIVALY